MRAQRKPFESCYASSRLLLAALRAVGPLRPPLSSRSPTRRFDGAHLLATAKA